MLSFGTVAFKKPSQTCDENVLYDYAIGALGRKMRTVAELKRLLRNRCRDEEVIGSVISRLKDHKYLSDSAYAAAYSAFRRDNQKFGRRRVITDLKTKGVHGEVIEKAIDEAYTGVDELELARSFLKRKRIGRPADNRAAARIFRALLRAGFGVSTSIKVLKNWKVEDEVISALEEEAGS
ncbi:MAG TPA: regulatory protein RecX [Candidatus Angelobacter sp.]|nr:regulatory protein RecX [Candidatus Angelobacter sp.]